jgi:hypothetical protein
MSQLTAEQIETIKQRVLAGRWNPCFILIDVGQDIFALLEVLKQGLPQVASWTHVNPPDVTRLSSLPGLDRGDIARLLKMKEEAEARDSIRAVETGGAYVRGSNFLASSGDIFLACFDKALTSSKAVVFYLGATHVPDNFARAIANAKTRAASGVRVFIVQDVGYLERADESVKALFQGDNCVNLVMSDTVDYYHQRATAILGDIPIAYDIACFGHGLQTCAKKEPPEVVFLVDCVRQLPDFERAVEWLREHPRATVQDCLRSYYFDRAATFYSFPPAKGGKARFESLLTSLANSISPATGKRPWWKFW